MCIAIFITNSMTRKYVSGNTHIQSSRNVSNSMTLRNIMNQIRRKYVYHYRHDELDGKKICMAQHIYTIVSQFHELDHSSKYHKPNDKNRCITIYITNSTRKKMYYASTQGRCIECLIFLSHFPQKSPVISGSFAEKDLQLEVRHASSPPCSRYIAT